MEPTRHWSVRLRLFYAIVCRSWPTWSLVPLMGVPLQTQPVITTAFRRQRPLRKCAVFRVKDRSQHFESKKDAVVFLEQATSQASILNMPWQLIWGQRSSMKRPAFGWYYETPDQYLARGESSTRYLLLVDLPSAILSPASGHKEQLFVFESLQANFSLLDYITWNWGGVFYRGQSVHWTLWIGVSALLFWAEIVEG